MNDCPTCAYRTTCNQRYRGQDCKYWKGETMSDIQTTEADRDEAYKKAAMKHHGEFARFE